MHRTSRFVLLTALLLLSAACGMQVHEATTPGLTPLPATTTLSVPLAQAATETLLPPSPAAAQPGAAPVDGVTSTRVNVRSEPSTAGAVLGMVPADTRVEITGKDPGENWWQINYPAGVDGKGWVTAQYVVTADKDRVPVIGGESATPGNGPSAVVQQQIHVRSGPGTSFNSLGILNPQDLVSLTGKDARGAWLQIDFPAGAGPDGKGWVSAAFVQARGVETLPIVTETGLVVGTGTPTAIPPTPTVTIVPAREDNDSATSPSARVVFEPAGTRTLIYGGDLSSPQGDAQDWVAFRPDAPLVYVQVECRGDNAVKIELMEDARPVQARIACDAPTSLIAVTPGANYLVHLQAQTAENLRYIDYVLTIKMRP